MGQPEAEQSCQWWLPLDCQAELQLWAWPEGGVSFFFQMTWRFTSFPGIWKLTSGTPRLASSTPAASQAAKA